MKLCFLQMYQNQRTAFGSYFDIVNIYFNKACLKLLVWVFLAIIPQPWKTQMTDFS